MWVPAEIIVEPDDALLIVDVQRDFLPGGSLAVPRGDAVVLPLNAWSARFAAAGLAVFATRDWHPPDHCSFRASAADAAGRWPPHCVAGTPGAQFAAALELPTTACIISKATQRDAEAYSGFAGTELHELLQHRGVRRLFVGGLATDYCVLNTVLDALRLEYRVMLLLDCMCAVDVAPGDGERAIAVMVAAGAETVGR